MIHIHNLPLSDYREILTLQRKYFSEMVEYKKEKSVDFDEHLFLLEHTPVITLGKHGKRENMLVSEAMLRQSGVDYVEIERGGDITYHGPGQLVVYPILDLERHKLGVKDYVHLLEESVIRTISHYGIKGARIDGASGVWIDTESSATRKICALGVKCSRFITMHGLALNVNTDLSGFTLINPCGFTNRGVTSILKETGRHVEMDDVKNIFAEEFLNLLR